MKEAMDEKRAIRCRVEPTEPLVCGELTTRTLLIEVEQEVLPGGSIRIYFTESPYYRRPPLYGLPAKGFIFYARVQFQADDPQGIGYLTAKAESGRALRIEVERNRCFFGVVCDEGLQIGDNLSIVIGDRRDGGGGIEVAHHPTYGGWKLVCDVDRRGDGGFVRQTSVPLMRVVPLPPSQVLVRAPSRAQPGVPSDLRITVTDRYGNQVEGYTGSLERAEGGTQHGPTSAFSLEPEDLGSKRFAGGAVFDREGVHRVTVCSIGGEGRQKLCGTSNPVLCTGHGDGYGLYWGDLHGHSYGSDGTHSPQFYYDYARAVGALDFCALTDHDTLDHDVWKKLIGAAASANAPGDFTSFLGYEWTGAWEQSLVVLFGNATGPYYPGRGGGYPDPYPGRGGGYPDPVELVALLAQEKDAMIMRHDMPPPGSQWQRLDATGQLERLVEIYSPFHASEAADSPLVRGTLDRGNSVQAALARGLRFGFIGCSDSHASMPGRRQGLSKGYPGYKMAVYGLTAVYARENTRKEIFGALHARRCYAATDRILVDFRINGHRMGEEIQLGGSRTITVSASGTAPLARVDVLRESQVIYSAGQGLTETAFEYREEEIASSTYYYVRVVQADKGMAWTSPIWVDPPDTEGTAE